jgi:F420-non-reducing hydrogenase iron-sulfur subunit
MTAPTIPVGATGTAAASDEPFEPLLIGFTCNWCSYRAADLAGTARIKYPPNIRLVRLMCAGRLDPAFVLQCFAGGADGVLVSGCWPGDCHYREQNYKGLRRFLLVRRVLVGMGIEPGRFQLVWASAAEGERLAHEIGRVVEEVRALGPLQWEGAACRVGTGEAVAHDPAPDASPHGAMRRGLEAQAQAVAVEVSA